MALAKWSPFNIFTSLKERGKNFCEPTLHNNLLPNEKNSPKININILKQISQQFLKKLYGKSFSKYRLIQKRLHNDWFQVQFYNLNYWYSTQGPS